MNITSYMNKIIKAHGEPKQTYVTRDGDRDLSFKGWLIGEGETGDGEHSFNWTRGTRVKIYLTTGGNLVVHVERWSCWAGSRDHNDAQLFKGDTAAMHMLAYLKDDCDGVLGRASKEAWEDVDLDFFPQNEEVE